MPDRVSVLIADDHPMFREAVARAVRGRAQLELVAECGDGREALSLIREQQPDVAVLDLRMPGLDGLQVLRAITREQLTTRVLILSAYVEGELVADAFSAGAGGYVAKATDRERVADAIVAVAEGRTVMPPEVQDRLAAQLRAQQPSSEPVLTPREHEILVLVGQGLQAPAIGDRLHLSPATVKGHLANVYEKLGVGERAAAVAEAMRRGLIE